MLNVNPWDILWTVINLLVFFLLLRRFLFKPVTKMMDEREAKIKADLETAEKKLAEAESVKADYDSKLAKADDEADKILATAKKRSEKQGEEIVAAAETEAAELLAGARKTIERERGEAVEAARDEIAELAVMAASQVLKRNIDDESNKEFAKQILAEVGAGND